MGKYSVLTQCEYCGFQAKNKKGLANHKRKCNGETMPKSKLYICSICKRMFKKNRIKAHEMSCDKYVFFNKYGSFLNFVFRLVLSYNKQNFKNKFARYVNEKKYIILNIKKKNCTNNDELMKLEKEFKGKDFIKNNRKILDDYYKEQKAKIEEEAESYKLNKKDSKYNMAFNLIQTIHMRENIDISFRQIALNFYVNKMKEKKQIINKKILQTINDRYYNKDFFTQQEIEIIDNDLLVKTCDLQYTCNEYNIKYNYFYDLLNEYFEGNTNKYLCVFCNKFVYYKWQHYRKCKSLQEEYNNSVYATFKKFIDNNFDKDTLNKIVPNNIYKNYINKDFYYFINNIKENIENPHYFDDIKNSFTYNINKVKIENIILEKYLNKIFNKIKKEYDIIINPRQQRYLREISIQNYVQNGQFKTNEIIKNFKIQYNLDIEEEKINNEHNNIINKLTKLYNIENNIIEDEKEINNEDDIDEEEINKEIEKNKVLAPKSFIGESDEESIEESIEENEGDNEENNEESIEENEEESIEESNGENKKINKKRANILEDFMKNTYKNINKKPKIIKYIIKK